MLLNSKEQTLSVRSLKLVLKSLSGETIGKTVGLTKVSYEKQMEEMH